MKTEPHSGLGYAWDPVTENFAAGLDADLIRIGALLQLGVKSKSLDISDISPSPNDRYIVPAGATGTFSGHDGHIAFYREGNWYFIQPKHGFSALVETPPGRWDFNASDGWVLQSVPEPGVGFEDAPADGKRYYRKDNAWVEFTDTESFVEVVTITSSTYSITPIDRGKAFIFTGGCVVTVEAGMPVTSVVYLMQDSDSAVNVIGADGVTLPDDAATGGRGAICVLMWLRDNKPSFKGEVAA